MLKPILLCAALAAVFLSTSALAASHPRGWTPPSPFTPFTPPTPSPHHGPAPAPTPPVKPPSPTQESLKDILSVKTELIAILQEVANDQAGVINSTTGQSWDAALIMCLNGNPGSGTPGQTGYVAPMPGLIAWLQSVQAPTILSVPSVVDPNNAAEVAEHARLLVLAGLQDAGNLVNLIQSNGSTLKQDVLMPCGEFMQDTFITVPTEIGGQIAAVVAVLKPYIPAAMAKHAVARHS